MIEELTALLGDVRTAHCGGAFSRWTWTHDSRTARLVEYSADGGDFMLTLGSVHQPLPPDTPPEEIARRVTAYLHDGTILSDSKPRAGWLSRFLTSWLGAALLSCTPHLSPEPPPTPPAPEPSPPGACAAAEVNLERLQCVEVATNGEQVQLWVGFAEACETSERDGSDWSAEHIACAGTCEQATEAWLGRWVCPEEESE